MGWTDVVQDRG